jgi:hypothetical protein
MKPSRLLRCGDRIRSTLRWLPTERWQTSWTLTCRTRIHATQTPGMLTTPQKRHGIIPVKNVQAGSVDAQLRSPGETLPPLIPPEALREDEAGALKYRARPRGVAGTVASALGRLRVEAASPAATTEGVGPGREPLEKQAFHHS